MDIDTLVNVSDLITLSICLSAVIGVLVGLLGGGGSTMTVPMLTFVAGLDIRQAITTSLVVVGVTSAVGAVAHVCSRRIQWRSTLLLGMTGIAGAYLGARLAGHVPGKIAMVAFAAIMIVSASALWRDRGRATGIGELDLSGVQTALLGTAVGIVSGLTGAGGGFLLVAALTLVCGMEIPVAVGTSLVVSTMHCFAALAGRLDTAHIDWRLTATITAAAIVGTVIGERLTAIIDPSRLRVAFGGLALLMGIGIIGNELNIRQDAQVMHALLALGLYTLWRRWRPYHQPDWLVRRPHGDLKSGRWQRNHADLLHLDEFDAGFRLLIADNYTLSSRCSVRPTSRAGAAVIPNPARRSSRHASWDRDSPAPRIGRWQGFSRPSPRSGRA